ncbi:MAG: T9SS type A sorting domain-containing protein [Saprospiraceae bacterium]
MKKIYTLLLLLFAISSVEAQSVSSSCVAEDSLNSYYHFDATKLAVRNLYNNASTDTSSVVVSEVYINEIMRALVAVHQAYDLPARDEVVDFYNIHALEAPATNRFVLYADTSHLWVRSWMNNELITELEEVNELVDSFELFFPRSSELIFDEQLGQTLVKVHFQSEEHLNLQPLLDLFRNIDGVVFCEKEIYQGEIEKDIQYTANTTENYVDLIYRYGWENCESGCRNEHFWNFRIYMSDCSVEFLSDSGSPLLVNNLNSISQVLTYPNPTSDFVNVKIVGPANADFIYRLHDAYGQLIESKDLGFHNGLINLQIDLSTLPVGVYFITLSHEGQLLTERVMRN